MKNNLSKLQFEELFYIMFSVELSDFILSMILVEHPRCCKKVYDQQWIFFWLKLFHFFSPPPTRNKIFYGLQLNFLCVSCHKLFLLSPYPEWQSVFHHFIQSMIPMKMMIIIQAVSKFIVLCLIIFIFLREILIQENKKRRLLIASAECTASALFYR